jgi:hypothetical protein
LEVGVAGGLRHAGGHRSRMNIGFIELGATAK